MDSSVTVPKAISVEFQTFSKRQRTGSLKLTGTNIQHCSPARIMNPHRASMLWQFTNRSFLHSTSWNPFTHPGQMYPWVIIKLIYVSEIHSFLSYFSHFKLFLPTNIHSPNTCFHLHYVLTTCSPPFYFILLSPFTPSPNHCKHHQKMIRRSIKDRSYLLARLFTRYLLPPDTFFHLIPYRKASLINSLNAHSPMNS